MAVANPQYQQRSQWRGTELDFSPPAASMSYGGAGAGLSMNYGNENFDNVCPLVNYIEFIGVL